MEGNVKFHCRMVTMLVEESCDTVSFDEEWFTIVFRYPAWDLTIV